MSEDVAEPVTKVLKSGMITQAGQVESFEKDLKDFLKNPHLLTLNSATAGLTLAVRLLDLQPDDVVLTPALTCFASTAAIMGWSISRFWKAARCAACHTLCASAPRIC